MQLGLAAHAKLTLVKPGHDLPAALVLPLERRIVFENWGMRVVVAGRD